MEGLESLTRGLFTSRKAAAELQALKTWKDWRGWSDQWLGTSKKAATESQALKTWEDWRRWSDQGLITLKKKLSKHNYVALLTKCPYVCVKWSFLAEFSEFDWVEIIAFSCSTGSLSTS